MTFPGRYDALPVTKTYGSDAYLTATGRVLYLRRVDGGLFLPEGTVTTTIDSFSRTTNANRLLTFLEGGDQ
ncbi:hypothetical protein GCM10025786_21500 [Nocardioides caeni]